MSRIFTTLASLNALGLGATFVLGIISQLRGAAYQPGGSIYLAHFNFGLFSAVGTLFVHCIIFTYFLGTGRWVKEVGLAYRLPDDPWPLLTRQLKRGTFPVALAAMLTTIAAAASGAGLQLKQWPWQAHAALALASLVVNLWAFRIEYQNVRRNTDAISQVLQEVERIRAERGLPSNAEALRHPT
jgi:hypothetical protein